MLMCGNIALLYLWEWQRKEQGRLQGRPAVLKDKLMVVMKLGSSLVAWRKVNCCGKLLSASRMGPWSFVLKWYSSGRRIIEREHVQFTGET